jgi:hypothetical protein
LVVVVRIGKHTKQRTSWIAITMALPHHLPHLTLHLRIIMMT